MYFSGLDVIDFFLISPPGVLTPIIEQPILSLYFVSFIRNAQCATHKHNTINT